jgi:radical SAM superfamily enzyme YgiQ (UPF0313 family)
MLPFPARHLRRHVYKANDKKTDYDVLMTSRGCYGRCTFCCEPSMSKGRLRWRSAENVLEEMFAIRKYHENKPVNVILADPNFMGLPKRIERLCDIMEKHDLNMEFCGLVRTDTMARNPEIVQKMCKVGICYFEMGIESPNLKDLNETKKGITTEIHREAVKNIRKNGGGAGGTFVIGLPEQTEEEIKSFPVYAKEIGMTAAAFGIVTPFPGTEFFKNLNRKNLIFEKNWDNFDEMHSVYKTKYLSKEKIEQLATYCMAKFWNIDTFLDREKIFQKRTKKKTSLIDFILERANEIQFMGKAGKKLKKEEFKKYIEIFLEAYVDPRVESYTKKVGVHNIIDMSRFLKILGAQTIQFSLNLNKSVISFVLKTKKNKVEYIKVIPSKQKNTTIGFTVDLNWFEETNQISKKTIMKKFISSNWRSLTSFNMLKLVTAVGTELLTWKLSK